MQSLLNKYAQTVIGALNLQHGQKLMLTGEACHWDAIVALTAEAYRQGAEYVEVNAPSSRLLRERLLHSHERYLNYQPKTIQALQHVLVTEKWARLAISSVEDPNILTGIAEQKNIAVQRALRSAQEEYKSAVMSDVFNWTICAVPTVGWASSVYPNARAHKAVQKLWKQLTPIYRLNYTDPAREWKKHSEKLKARAETLTKLQINELHFQAPGTDFHVFLHPKAQWKGGGSISSEGIPFLPNIPTEEVFTTPDFRQTYGTVRLTKPAMIFDKAVEGVDIVFKDGIVVDVHAEKNGDILKGLLESDAGAKMVGEIALVDSSSPIFQSNTVFNNILLDENAACHFAFGGAYPSCLEGGVAMTMDERIAHGINNSVVHNDVMIGSKELQVTAYCHSNTSHKLIVNGTFTDLLA